MYHFINREPYMRYVILLSFMLFNQAMALDSKEIVGMWKGRDAQSGIDLEYFFAQDGNFETRGSSSFLGSVNTDGFGKWKVKGEAIYDSLSHGWVAFAGTSPFPMEA